MMRAMMYPTLKPQMYDQRVSRIAPRLGVMMIGAVVLL
jgi:hypothetical protein